MLLATFEGTEFEVFPFGPDDAKTGILLVHDWWGVLDYNREWAERLSAELNSKTLVVDLYDGERARNAEQAGDLMRSLDQEEVDAKLVAALDYLKASGRDLATLGWSLGGRQALQAALLDPEAVRAAVIFYCRLVTDPEALAELNGPLLTIYAERERTWPDKMERFEAAMAEAGKEVVSVTYDAEHGFANPGSERYNPDYAKDALERSIAFLRQNLG